MELLLLLLLILMNGLLAMSEIAVVSSRKARLQKLANDNRRGARRNRISSCAKINPG